MTISPSPQLPPILGVMALVGPFQKFVRKIAAGGFLLFASTAIALLWANIADDIGAVLVIALFYTQSITWYYLLVALFFLCGIVLANMLWIRYTLLYVLLGIGVWIAILGSGIHATVTGVIVALLIPARGRYDTATFIQKVSRFLEKFDCDFRQLRPYHAHQPAAPDHRPEY